MTVANPIPGNANPIRSLAGWFVQYFASGLLVPALLLCLGALVFCQIALLGPNVGWLGQLAGWLPASARAWLGGAPNAGADVDLGTLVLRAFWILSLGVTALELLVRWLRAALFGKPAMSAAGKRRVVGRRMLLALMLVSAVFGAAMLAVPHAHMAAGASRAGLYDVFVALYVVALGFAIAWAAVSGVAARLLDGTSH